MASDEPPDSEPSESPATPEALRIAAWTLGADRLAVEVVDVLGAAGVPCLVLRGPALARWLYDGDEFRPYVDVDVLVPPGSWSTAAAALTDAGFTAPLANMERHKHAVGWERGVGPSLDLHRTLVGVRASDAVLWRRLVRHRREMPLFGHDVPALDEVALALVVALHVAQSGPEPKPRRDLQRVLERLPADGWPQVHELAQEVDALAALGAGLRVLPAGRPVADELALPAAGHVEEVLRSRGAPVGALFLEQLRDATGWRERAGLVVSALFPSRAFFDYYDPPRRPGALPMLWVRARWPLRLVRWLPRALRARRSARSELDDDDRGTRP